MWSRFRRDDPQKLSPSLFFFITGDSALVSGDSALVTGHSALLFAVLSLYISSSAMYMHIQPLLETFV